MYILYRRLPRRNIMRKDNATLEEAKTFLLTERSGFVEDYTGNSYQTIEELENAENIRPETRAWEDHFSTNKTEISEDTDRELSEPDSDRTEPSSECDN